MVVSFGATTQFIAHAFGYAPVLGRPLFGHIYQPLASAQWLINLDMKCVVIAKWRHFACAPQQLAFLTNAQLYLAYWLGGTAFVVGSLAIAAAIDGSNRRRLRGRVVPKILVTEGQPAPFMLTVGKSTGKLLQLGHGAAIAVRQTVRLVDDEASQNILVLGGTGSGKTTAEIQPLVDQCFRQDCGVLAFDVKGDFERAFRWLAARAGRTVTTIGMAGKPLNLLGGLSAEIAASFIKSALLLAGNTSSDATFWNELATELSRNVLGVLSYLPKHYTLSGLYKYIFNPGFHDEIEGAINEVYERLTHAANDPARTEADRSAAEADRLRLQRYADYESSVFESFDEKVKSGVKAQLSQILSLFTLPELEAAFCNPAVDSVRLEDLIDGAALVLNLPIQRYGLAAKTVYTFVKLRFFQVMERRRIEPQWNQTRRVVFVCDEYQAVVSIARDAMSDLTFWDKSRASKCVGIISAQGVESFRAAIGSQSLTDALLQNFRQILCFGTEDEATIKKLTFVLGQVEVERENRSKSRSRSSSTSGSSGSRSESTNFQRQMQSTINPQLFRQLAAGEVLAILRIGNQAFDDILTTTPLYVPVEETEAARVAAVS
jgi:type IV secretory pathway TraG/TraD family ATPase VirD4